MRDFESNTAHVIGSPVICIHYGYVGGSKTEQHPIALLEMSFPLTGPAQANLQIPKS